MWQVQTFNDYRSITKQFFFHKAILIKIATCSNTKLRTVTWQRLRFDGCSFSRCRSLQIKKVCHHVVILCHCTVQETWRVYGLFFPRKTRANAKYIQNRKYLITLYYTKRTIKKCNTSITRKVWCHCEKMGGWMQERGEEEGERGMGEIEWKKMKGGRTRGILFQSQSFLLPPPPLPFPPEVCKLLMATAKL